jgi:transcriptional regulator with XRE-family HTH domain
MRENISDFAQAIKSLLDERNMRPLHLARKAGVSSGYLSEVLSGKKGVDPALSVIQRIAAGLDMSTEAFINRIEHLARRRKNQDEAS